MENNTENGSSHSWWLDNNTHDRLHQSPWLQSTLSDLEKKVKKTLSFIEDDGDTFAQRAEMFYKKKPLLIKSVEDLHESYMLLAEKYDQLMLKYENIRTFRNLGSPTFSNPNRFPPKLQKSDHDNDHNRFPPKFQSSDHDNDQNSEVDSEKSKNKGYEFVQFDDDLGKRWNEMRLNVMKLVEDNLEQQAELVKRNDRKREAINELRAHVNKLVAENNEMKNKLARMESGIKRNRSQFARAKDVILKKILPEPRNLS